MRATKRDGNEQAIVDALVARGWLVAKLSTAMGTKAGLPDLLVWVTEAARYVLLEVKEPGEKLRPGQAAWHEEWRAKGALVFSVSTVEEAVAACGSVSQPEHR